jgi:hypothetical protein
MNGAIEFKAPWSSLLRTVSIVMGAVLVALTLASLFAWYSTREHATLVGVIVPVLVLIIATLLTVKGYALTEDAIVVRRLGWTTRLPWQDLVSVTGDNEAMRGSVKLFGSAGFMSYTGYFWNRRIGRYRAFVNDPSRSVVLSYKNRKIVISPDDPQRFIVRARTMLKNRGAPW